MRWWNLTLLALVLGGCVSSTEVKQASSEITVALDALREAGEAFEELYLKELEATHQIISRAIIAKAVQEKIRSSSLATMEQEGDLLAISEAIRVEHDAYRELIGKLRQSDFSQVKDPGNFEPTRFLKEFFQNQIADVRKQAGEMERNGQSDLADELRRQADQMEHAPIPMEDDLAALVRLQLTQLEARRSLAGLDDYLMFLQRIHSQVDGWISQDVKIAGEDVATLIEKHQDLLGLGPATGRQP